MVLTHRKVNRNLSRASGLCRLDTEDMQDLAGDLAFSKLSFYSKVE